MGQGLGSLLRPVLTEQARWESPKTCGRAASVRLGVGDETESPRARERAAVRTGAVRSPGGIV